MAFVLEQARWLLTGTYTDGDAARIAPFPEVELDIARLFLPLPGSAS